ncbi:fused MFS/spermidine synthase [Caulifigura coniformis]|nr:fused MFS/spermidine synthase [Caulifigura coniformis]
MAGIFGLSGSAALIYQVAWQRILALHSGVGIYSVAMIVAAFMAGLGIGSYWGGLKASRFGASRSLLWFAGIELAVGAFATISTPFYYDLLGSHAGALYSSLGRAGVVHFVALLLPTCLMGMSLPFLVQAAVHDVRFACQTIGVLYGINILGAALGALLAPWVLIRSFGIDGAIWFGAATNIAAGLLSLLLWATRGAQPDQPAPETPPQPAKRQPGHPASRPFASWLLLYTLSGFFALALEILWFRIIDVGVRSTAFTFGSVLAIYLLGLGLGCVFGGRFAVRVRSPLRAFLACQTLLLIYSGAVILLIVHLPTSTPGYATLVDYWKGADIFALGSDWNWSQFILLYLAFPVALYGPPTVLMGLSFAVLQKAVHDDRQTTGRKVGFLQTGNILGNVAGSLAIGLVLMGSLGTPDSLRLLLGAGLIFPFLSLLWAGRDGVTLLSGAMLAGLVFIWPSSNQFWSRLHGSDPEQAAFAEDASGLMAITPALDEGGALRVSMNGKWQSWLPFGGIHSELGAVASILHPEPKDICIIGLGSGDTAWAAACRPQTERVVVYEICAAEQKLLAQIAPVVPDLASFLKDRRIHILAEDGRQSLAQNPALYDVIEADALRPTSAYAGNIYSIEFFKLCASRLKPGGLMCQWGSTPRVYRTFREAFPHVVELPGRKILIGSNDPIPLDRDRWAASLNPQVRAYLGPAIVPGMEDCLSMTRPMAPDTAADRNILTDLFPRDEFVTPGP